MTRSSDVRLGAEHRPEDERRIGLDLSLCVGSGSTHEIKQIEKHPYPDVSDAIFTAPGSCIRPCAGPHVLNLPCKSVSE